MSRVRESAGEQQAAAAAAPTAAAATSASASASSSDASPRRKLEELHFDNLALRTLPIDPDKRNVTRQVPGACFSLVEPTPVENPKLVCFSPDVLSWIEVDERETDRPDFVDYFSGNKLLPGTRPAAHCYCGYQFGHFSGQLGDGATMYLGEIITSKGERVEIQFKGAGHTPYSRQADGRKVLRSSLREFLCSEAHHYLGIPTTRAGTIVTSDTRVARDMFYDGNTIYERATVITRLAPTFLRFGSFEITKGVDPITGRKGPSTGRTDITRAMIDYVCDTFYKDVCDGLPTREEKYLAFFKELTRRTAVMVAKWQAVGWCHGVLNTDNMSIVGLTIDYGPFGFMEPFDPDYICNNSDNEGRYRYQAQPEMCGWNLMKLTQSFEPLGDANFKKGMRDIVAGYEDIFQSEYDRIMYQKLGLGVYAEKGAESSSSSAAASEEEAKRPEAAYDELLTTFLRSMAETGGDFTNCFRCLSKLVPGDQASYDATLRYLVSQCATVATRVAALTPRIPPAQLNMIQQLMRTQPGFFDRPGMEEQKAIIEAELERAELRESLKKQSQQEKDAQDTAVWRGWLDTYVPVLAAELQQAQTRWPDRSREDLLQMRALSQNSANPKYILRNWIAQTVIDAAEKGDYGVVRECLERLRDPYDVEDKGVQEKQPREAASASAMEEQATREKPHPPTSERDERAHTNLPPKGTTCAIHWDKERPAWASGLKVTCSS